MPARDGFTSVFSTVTRRGQWVLPRALRVAAFMGHANLDLTQVAIAPGGASIEVLSLLGEVEIVVPRSLRVECSVNPVLGEFELKATNVAPPSPTAPLVRISGSAVLGRVRVRVVDPSTPRWWETWLEQRRERGQKRREKRDRKHGRGRPDRLTD
ncbi:MAG TPA: LiaF domain-containing protein [Gemmatimonadaceae bacterium]|nr:LiaF domain-containing protein [Gemmatimonadaceae bacterium]